MSTSGLSASWMYRSFNPTYVTGDQTPQEELDLILADGVVLTINPTDPINPTGVEGRIEWQGGGLDLKGTSVSGQEIFDVLRFDIVGTGRPGTGTAGWEYVYHGHMTSPWGSSDAPWLANVIPPRRLVAVSWGEGIDQVTTLVGSVIRAKTHNGRGESPAGEVFSFIAVKQVREETDWWRLPGSWTYRSFHNKHTRVYPAAPPTAHGLILQEAVFKLETPTDTTLQGTIELSGGGVLDIDLTGGEVRPAEVPPEFTFRGTGRPGTGTAGWEYVYHGHLTRQWPNGINQRPALVGSVIRLKPHGEAAPAGSVYPFIAVKQ
jgi:hypothetical protein